MGDQRQEILTIFVSVDPERDTPEKIKEYLEYFNIHAVGLTGTKKEVDSVVNAYKASYEKVDTGSALGYLLNHSDYLYLIDWERKVAIFSGLMINRENCQRD
ncbi:MAG: SCO family protein [Candidatus Omnitrophica bacterium]|nr:SCO family protein [Candidatus Omnitrophota bacterium]